MFTFQICFTYKTVSTSCQIALRWIPQSSIDIMSTLVQVMAWCCQATSHFLGQCWPSSMLPYGNTRPQWVESSPSNLFQHQGPGLGSIQFRNWNCSSIPIPIPELELELELELKLVELKMELELKTLELELELKTGIEFFAATAAITSWPTISKF